MKCPKCYFEQSDTNTECPRCGVIFARLDIGTAPQDPSRGERGVVQRTNSKQGRDQVESRNWPETASAAPKIPARGRAFGDDYREQEIKSESEAIAEPLRMYKEDWFVLTAGLAIAAVVFAIPILKHIFGTLMVLVHEMGHMIFGWVFGYPSLPAFDLVYGGGITLHTARSTLLLIVIYVLLGFLIFSFRRNTSAVILLLIVTAIHVLFTVTRLHETTILFMGHGTELLIAGIFFYRALSGAAVVHFVERPLYAAIAFFILFSDLSFAYRLMTSPFARAEYADAKGGGHWMDFSRIAIDQLHVSLNSVALVFFLFCLITLPAGFLAFRYQEHLRGAITRLGARQLG